MKKRLTKIEGTWHHDRFIAVARMTVRVSITLGRYMHKKSSSYYLFFLPVVCIPNPPTSSVNMSFQKVLSRNIFALYDSYWGSISFKFSLKQRLLWGFTVCLLVSSTEVLLQYLRRKNKGRFRQHFFCWRIYIERAILTWHQNARCYCIVDLGFLQ